MSKSKIVFDSESGNAWLSGSRTAVTVSSSKELFEKPDAPTRKIGPINGKENRGVIPWGENNDLPNQILAKIEASELVGANLYFNNIVAYGSGIEYGKIVKDSNGFAKLEPMKVPEIDEFFENNDILGYLLQQFTDINTFFNSFCELIFDSGLPNKRKVVSILHKQAAFSRYEECNEVGIIENHFYSARWNNNPTTEDIEMTPLLNHFDTMRDVLTRTGKLPNKAGKLVDLNDPSYVVSMNIPTPGRLYYSKPNWWSIFESGWYDFAMSIPTFKKYMLKNQATIKYHIELESNYFKKIFSEEKITTDSEKMARMKKEFENFDNFLSDPKNTNKSLISYIDYTAEGKEFPRVKIKVIDNPKVGGEYIEDSEEASNIISYAMGVHQSLFGTSPNKNKTINGTEARELFIIKQALQKPLRDRVLKPFYLIKKLNNWPSEVGFSIANLVLTTLDANTGSTKKIS